MQFRNRLDSVGHSVPYAEGRAKLHGEPIYTFDLALPGMLHVKLLRSPHAHARIVSIDTAGAAGMPGVRAVATGADIAGLPQPKYGKRIRDQAVLAMDKVRFVGDIVAAVAAGSEEDAIAAVQKITVQYDVLPSVMTIDDALKPGAPLLFDEPQPGYVTPYQSGARSFKEPEPNVLYRFEFETGEPIDETFARCVHIFTDRFVTTRLAHMCLEPFVVLASETHRGIELWSCSQYPFQLREEISTMFGEPEHRVVVNTAFVGGAFGGKSFCKLEPIAVMMSRLSGRPVRLCLTMDETIALTTKHAAVLEIKTGVAADGTFLARDSRIWLDSGAYSDASALVADKAGYRIPGPYRWQAIRTRVDCIRTTSIPGGSFRGFGGVQAAFASESQVDMIARRIGRSPDEIRLKNFLSIGEEFVPGERGMDCDLAAGYRASLARGSKLLPISAEPHLKRGVGSAAAFKDGGGEPRVARARIKMTTQGRVSISTSGIDMGQGSVTAMCQIAAEALRVPVSWVSHTSISTEHSPFDVGTYASSAIALIGGALVDGADNIRAQVLDISAGILGIPVAELTFDNDWTVSHAAERHSLAQILLKHFGGTGYELEGEGKFIVPADAIAPLKSKRMFWMPCWSHAQVEVDIETGCCKILSLDVAIDAGRAINPASAHGQVKGGALQALGHALFEGLVYDGDVPANGTPWSYRAPFVTDLPEQFTSHLEEHGMGPGPFGSKGIGEAPVLGIAAAVANAVEDAVGVRITTLPITPEKILRALRERDASRNDAQEGETNEFHTLHQPEVSL